MKLHFPLFIMCVLPYSLLKAQGVKKITLEEMIRQTQTQSAQFKVAETQNELNYYQYLTYKSDLKPQISLYGILPSYSKQYTPIVQPDGTIVYLPLQQNTNQIGFSLDQKLPFSGGNLSLNMELSQFYDFKSQFKQYNGTPFFLRLNQPLFGFNQLKWSKKIEPLKLKESRVNFAQQMEDIARQVSDLYFQVLYAQSNIIIAKQNVISTKVNYDIEKKRIKLGTTTEDKVLQLELQTLKSSQELEKSNYDYKVAELNLRNYAGITNADSLQLELPENISFFLVDVKQAVGFAKEFRPEYIKFERERLEGERNVAEAKAANKQINLTATYGLNRAADNLETIYSDPKGQQTISVGINVPFIDWGRRRARYNTAKAQEKLTNYTNQLGDVSIVQEIVTLVTNIDLLKSGINLARKTDSVALLRFDIANKLFKTNKLSITELNLAQQEKDNSRRLYISALKDYWSSYYLLRKQTMFDFEKKLPLYSTNKVEQMSN
jgi:outer membrane protein TolC